MKLFPVKTKQLASESRVKHSVENWQKLTNNAMIISVVRSYEVFFILSLKQSRLLNVYHLTKNMTYLLNQEVQDMLRKNPIAVLDPEEDHFSPSNQPKGPEP